MPFESDILRIKHQVIVDSIMKEFDMKILDLIN